MQIVYGRTEFGCKQKIPVLPVPSSATEARNAATLFINVIAQVNLFYAVTLV